MVKFRFLKSCMVSGLAGLPKAGLGVAEWVNRHAASGELLELRKYA